MIRKNMVLITASAVSITCVMACYGPSRGSSTLQVTSGSSRAQAPSVKSEVFVAHFTPAINNNAPSSVAEQKPGWSTYRSRAYQYEIRYPRDASVATSNGGRDEHDEPDLEEIRIQFVQSFESNVGAGRDLFAFRVTVYSNPASLTGKQWGLDRWSPAVVRGGNDIRIGALSGYRMNIFKLDSTSDYIYFAKNAHMYVLSYWNPESMFEFSVDVRHHYDEIFQVMLKSFRVD